MNSTLLIVVLVLLMFAVGIVLVLVLMGDSGKSSFGRQAAVSSNLRSLVASQRTQQKRSANVSNSEENASLALAAAAESELSRKKAARGSRNTLEKKLKYARWIITPLQFRAIQLAAFIVAFIPSYLYGTIFIQLITPLVPLMVGGILDKAVKKRFNEFDADYPALLLSYVSLLKTGMSTIAGLEAAAKGLDHGTLVRSEVELLVERLRLGLTEEQAISSFGEDVDHPELELFVQSLLLSRRVGGTLSTTLERLAKQVRKRQQFRQQAVAAVGMERSSIYVIAFIMTLLLGYLAFASPELIFPAFSHPLGMKIFTAGLMLISYGFFWSKTVTNIKI